MSSLKFRFLVVAIAAAMMIFGITQIPNSPVDVFPEFAPPYVEIQTEAFGLSTIETEELVTVNMEEWLTGTGMLKSIRSKSVSGLSSVIVTFQPGTEMMLVRQYISERLTTLVGLPNVSKTPVMLQPHDVAENVAHRDLCFGNIKVFRNHFDVVAAGQHQAADTELGS